MTLMPDHQPPEVLKPSEKPFNFPAAFRPPQLSSVLSFWLLPVAAVRTDHLNTLLFQKIFQKISMEAVAVIRFIADKFFRQAADEETVKRSFYQLHLMRRSACKTDGDRKTGSVRNSHDPAPFAPLCPADRPTPFLAGTKLPSINASWM